MVWLWPVATKRSVAIAPVKIYFDEWLKPRKRLGTQADDDSIRHHVTPVSAIIYFPRKFISLKSYNIYKILLLLIRVS